jgi:MFS family permease
MAGGRSARALDWLNFFTANVQTGFGPFVVVYLTTQAWTEVQIGLVLSIGTATMMLCQVPAGLLVDATPRKRLAALVAILCIAFSALLMVLMPSYLPVLGSQVLHGIASCVLTPAIAAISLALVGRRGLGERLGRNARFGALGSGVAAGVMGAVGAWFSAGSVFWLTAALTLPALAALAMIRQDRLHPPPVRPVQATAAASDGGFRALLLNRGVLVFAGCAMLFTLSNASLLPLASTEITRTAGDNANLVIAACIVVPQLVMCAIAPAVGRMTESHGRRLVLLAGLLAVALRGLLMAVVDNPFAIAAIQALDGVSAAVMGVLVPLLAADLTRGSNRFNLCMSLFGLAVGLGGTVSTALAGAIASWVGLGAAYAVLTAAGIAGFLLAALAMPETREGHALVPAAAPVSR